MLYIVVFDLYMYLGAGSGAVLLPKPLGGAEGRETCPRRHHGHASRRPCGTDGKVEVDRSIESSGVFFPRSILVLSLAWVGVVCHFFSLISVGYSSWSRCRRCLTHSTLLLPPYCRFWQLKLGTWEQGGQRCCARLAEASTRQSCLVFLLVHTTK